nr:ATP-binding protein [Microbacterium karelineae]
MPKSLWETVSAFSNRGGGLILLGLDEQAGFAPADGFDAAAVRDAISEVLRPRRESEPAGPVTPRPHGSVDIGLVDDAPVVVVEIEELPADLRPVYVSSQGVQRGTYERVGDGDRRMSSYGVFLLTTNATLPGLDVTSVDGASISDLDASQIDRFLERIRRTRPRTIEGLASTSAALRRLRVLSSDERTPTVAGLLCFGRYPQEFLPQAMVSFAVYPGVAKEQLVGDLRMIDRRILEGPIPLMVEDAVRATLENLKTRRVSRGAGARDEPEIPVDAIREGVANALAHRDYSAQALGEQVRVEMFPDRVEISNPGDIWGGRRVIDLFEGVSRSRNAALASLLTDVPLPGRDDTVSENGGCGIPRMAGAMGLAGLGTPRFDVTSTHVTLSLDRHGLLDPDEESWLADVGAEDLPAESQRVLVLVHRGVPVDIHVLRTTFGMDCRDAESLLRRLTEQRWLGYPLHLGQAYRVGERLASREAELDLLEGIGPLSSRTELDERIISAVRDAGELDVHSIAARVQRTLPTVRPRLRVLVEEGALIATAPPTSRNRRYRPGVSG